MAATKIVGVTVLVSSMLFASPVVACSLGGLEHRVAFPEGESMLPASTVLALANWKATIKVRFPEGGAFAVFPQYERSFDKVAAAQRRASLRRAIEAIALSGQVVDLSKDSGTMETDSTDPDRLLHDAYVGFQPACPQCHCPQPIGE